MPAIITARVFVATALIALTTVTIVLGARTWVASTNCDQLVQYSVWSPDGQWIAESNLEGCWMSAAVYVTLHPASEKRDIQDAKERILWVGDTYSDGYSDVILHWIDSRHLEIGLPIESSAKVRPLEFRGIHLKYTYFPNDAEQLQKRSEFVDGKLTRDDWIKYRESHVSSITNVAERVQRIAPNNISYASSETTDEYGTKWCRLDMNAIDGVFFQSVDMQLIANVDRRGTAGFQVNFSTNQPLIDSLRPLVLTGAQFVGSSFANNPVTVFRQKTAVSFSFLTADLLANFIRSLDRSPYSVTLILDLPETVIRYDISEAPRRELISSLFRCVGQAKAFGRDAADLNPD